MAAEPGTRGTPPPRAVLFDMDGVLLDSYEAWRGLVRAAGRDLAGREITDAEFHETWGQGVAADVERFFPGRSEAEVGRYYLEHFTEHAAGVRVDPEAETVLAELRRRGVRTAVITNTPGALARSIIAGAGLETGPVLGGDDVPRAKPAPDLVSAASALLGVPPAAALVVGDSRFDREAAAAAGAPFVGVGEAGGEVSIARLGALLRLVPGPPSRFPRPGLRQASLIALVALACFAVGYGLRAGGRRTADWVPAAEENPDYQIRGQAGRYTNPLLDCEVAGYRSGRELRPFKAEIERLAESLVARGVAGRISVYFRDLDNGPWFGIREEEGFTPASLGKVPTVMAALLQAEETPGFLARVVRFEGYPGEELPGQWEPDERLARGQAYTIDELIRRTARYSDNASVSLLGAQVDLRYRERVFDELGLPHVHGSLDEPVALTPRLYGQLFRVLYNASFLGRAMSERALEHFAQSTFGAGLVGGVPAGTPVAHKFGIYALPGRPAQLHDCGIVYRPGRPYFLCVMTEGQDANRLAEAIREISAAVSGAVAAPGPGAAGG